MLIKVRKAQSTLEYGLLITVVVGALLSMQNYLKRSSQDRLRTIGDQISPNQYSPGLTYRNEYMKIINDNIQEDTARGEGGLTTTMITGGHQESNFIMRVKPLNEEIWPKR